LRCSGLREYVYRLLRYYGGLLSRHGYVAGHGGNLSLRSGGSIYITRHGARLEDLRPDDVVEVPLEGPSSLDAIASSEILLHRAVYLNGAQHLAIVHTHSLYATAASYFLDELKPLDVESAYVLRSIPIVEGPAGSAKLAERVAEALKDHHAVVVRGHGVFTAAKVMDVAYRYACLVERSAMLWFLVETLKAQGLSQREVKEL